jgi:hypothetical protein
MPEFSFTCWQSELHIHQHDAQIPKGIKGESWGNQKLKSDASPKERLHILLLAGVGWIKLQC